MPLALQVADGVVTKDRLAEGEAANFEALKRAVLAEETRKKQEEHERRISQGLPAELTKEEKKEAKRQQGEQGRKESLGKRILAKIFFGP